MDNRQHTKSGGLPIRVRQHREHTRHFAGNPCIDRPNVCMGMRAVNESGVGAAGQVDIIDVVAATAHQPDVFVAG